MKLGWKIFSLSSLQNNNQENGFIARVILSQNHIGDKREALELFKCNYTQKAKSAKHYLTAGNARKGVAGN